MPQELEVRPITASETWPLRQKVLRPGRPVETAIFSGDEDPENQHFGVLVAGELVGVASLFKSPLPVAARRNEETAEGWQLRGMAVDPSRQKAGLGKALLNAIFKFIAQQPNALLWCNSRSEAVEFYRRAGFETRGEEFEIPDVGPHCVMVYNPHN